MDIFVSARHFPLSEALKVASENAVHTAFDDINLKISSVRIVLDIQKNDHLANVVVAIKDYTVEASATNVGDMNKSIIEAVDRAAVQARKYLDKKQFHRDRETIKENPEE